MLNHRTLLTELVQAIDITAESSKLVALRLLVRPCPQLCGEVVTQ